MTAPATPTNPAAPTAAPTATQGPCDGHRLFRHLVPPELIDAWQPSASQAIYTAYVTVWLMLYQRFEGGASLEEAVSALLFNFPKEDLPDCKRLADGAPSADTGSYAKARQRLDKPLAEWLADHVHSSLAAHCQPAWKGRRVDLLDGSTFSLAPTTDLRLIYPPATNQYGESHWPVLLAVVAHDLDSGLACRPEYGPMYGDLAEGEVALALRLLPRLSQGSVLLADGNFGIFVVAYRGHKADHDVLLRLSKPRFEALRRQAQPAGPGRWEVTWRPTKQERKKHDLPEEAEVRGYLVEVRQQRDGKEEVLYLFTTLAEGTNEEWGGLYARRWCVETDIAAQKATLKLGEVSGKTADMVEKELLLATVAYNLTIQVRRLAAAKAGVEPRRLSFSGTASLFRAFARKMASCSLSEEQMQNEFDKLLKACGQRKLPKRPGRRAPRQVIPRRQRYDDRKRCPAEFASPGSGAFDYPPKK
jgi:Transposase DDE domain